MFHGGHHDSSNFDSDPEIEGSRLKKSATELFIEAQDNLKIRRMESIGQGLTSTVYSAVVLNEGFIFAS